MHGRGACMAGAVHGRRHAWQRGHAWQGGMRGRGACVAGELATAAGGTHPSGMHSCSSNKTSQLQKKKKKNIKVSK